jgi:FkbM family methyltransferase
VRSFLHDWAKRDALQKPSTIRRIRNGIIDRFKKLTFRPKIIERSIAGEKIRFLIGDLFGESAYGPKHVDWPELNWIKDHCIKPGDVVVDCGANHGFSTVLFAKWVGERGKVYAFEPSSHNMAILKENLQLNSVTNVICYQAAVGAAAGRVSISSHPNASVVLSPGGDDSLEKVALVKLDDVLQTEKPNFVKLDVEGFEREALKGARRLLASAPRLDLELHVAFYKNKENELSEVFDMLPLERYSLFVQPTVDGPIVPFEKHIHTREMLVKSDVVHLFCQ